MRLVLEFQSDELSRMYPVIVEMWDKVVPYPARCGSKNRKYKAEFTEQERKTISTWHTKFYRWHLVTGAPETIVMDRSTYQLLRRASYFFATV